MTSAHEPIASKCVQRTGAVQMADPATRANQPTKQSNVTQPANPQEALHDETQPEHNRERHDRGAQRPARWSRNKLALVLVAGVMAFAGQVGAAEIDKPIPQRADCVTRNAQIIQEVRSDPAIVDALRLQHDSLDGPCRPAAEIAEMLSARSIR